MPLDRTEAIAIEGLAFIAEDAARLGRFLALTGLAVADLRARASTPAVLGSVLEHLLGDESLLLVFAAEKGIAAGELLPAARALSAASPARS